ncbi:translocation/assembly module TamB domain-containing protein [uncultured Draconibacterium sp.]|uniref:translocation/assembly module TamB domain-containing protein n=1 Tax=uncultured Draconibacterium sp. TaxID=1573823 RepID=UPI0025E7BD4A|nr:translocation/assembly module TamB domain-containing protein [uncultured Draconibacterium sp.]
MKSIIQKILLFLAWLLAGIVILLLISGLLIQTRPVKNKLARVAAKQAEKVVNGELMIGKISGNFFSHLELEDVLWKYEDDTLVYINSVAASYSLWSLTRGELQLSSASINSPYVYLKQQKDSTWNVESLLKEQAESSPDTTSASGNFQLLLSNLQINEGRMQIQALDSLIPDEVKNINLEANGAYSSNEQTITLKRFDLQTQRPDFDLRELTFAARRTDENIALNNFHIKTAQNALNAEAKYSDAAPTEISAEMQTEPINIKEFEFLLPQINLPARPEVDFKVNSIQKGVEATLSVRDKEQQIKLDLASENLLQFINGSDKTGLKYKVSGNVDNINLAHWMGSSELDHTINGKFKIDGNGIDPKTAELKVNADFKDCVFAQTNVEKIEMNLRVNRGDLSGKIDAEGNFGAVSVQPKIKDLLDRPKYELQLVTKSLNLAPLLGNDSLQSDINLIANLSGEDFDPERLQARANLKLSPSTFSGYKLDSLVGDLSYSQKNIVIDSLWANAKSLHLTASGNYNLVGNSDLQLSADFDDAEVFEAFIPLDSVYGQGIINAQLSGKPDSLSLASNVELQDAGFSDISAEKIEVNATAQLTSGDTTFSAVALVENFNAGSFVLDSIRAAANYFIDSLQVEMQANGNEFQTQLKSEIVLGDVIKIALLEWSLDFKNQHLHLADAPAEIELDSLEYRLSNLKMVSADSDTAQYIKAGGVFSQYGDEDFQFEVANINIAGLLESLGLNTEISGKINAEARLKGTASSPELDGNLSIDKALVYGYKFTDFGGAFNLQNDRLNFDAQIVPLDTGLLEINANIPLEARFDSMSFLVDSNATINGGLTVQRFPLSAMQFLEEAEKVEGFLNGQVNVGGTLKSPEPDGNLSLNNAEVLIPKYGIEYKNIVLDLHFSEDAAQLDSFYIKTDDGNLKASGTVDFGSAIYNGKIKQSEINIHFNAFNPVDHRQFNMELSGDASLKSEGGKMVFDGDLEIPEANIYLPAIMNLTGQFTEPELPQPVLMREIEKLKDTTASSVAINDTISTNDTLDLSSLANLTGRLSVSIPQNTWIKNKDMFVEISGKLEVIKNPEFFELFGNIDVVRGQYQVLGKTFKIDEGSITFQGGEEMMPRLNIQAVYAFRNPEKVEQELTVRVSGTASQPEINFALDGNQVSEGDALSYILFGVSMDELTIEQQENVSGAGQIAGSAAMSLLSSQLTQLLGEKLDVDYIELKGDGDFENATVVVGKYITNDLFVSYEQRFGETDEKDISKYEVKLEYELFRFLFLQLNNSSTESGFDVIIKLDSK